jgi:uncharacterized repeat protein (TIGR03806 family)
VAYETVVEFGNLSLNHPLDIRSAPGETNRLFIVEETGCIIVITNLANPTRTVFLDLSSVVADAANGGGLLSLEFHPGYATNRYFYVVYQLRTTSPTGTGVHNRVARFEASASDPNQALPDSEQPLITILDGGDQHNFDDLRFGPEGYLYVSTGDEAVGGDWRNNSQRIDKDFYSGILRLDVDQKPENLSPNPHPAIHVGTYKVPADNPFVEATLFNGVPVDPALVRTEFWAVGLRNPWRMAFDPQTGVLYCGDVGEDSYEELDIITKGGNYGWAYREGEHPGPKVSQEPSGSSSIPPLLEYPHGFGSYQGNCIIGGQVYRGAGFPELDGFFLFADFNSGHIWRVHYDGQSASGWGRLATDEGIAAFGVDPRNGDVLLVDWGEEKIKRLTSQSDAGGPLPATLSGTGAFADTANLVPAPGVVPYELNVPFWSDHAIKTRWVSVPDLSNRIDFNADGHWSFPTGTVWVKHFELELTNGVASSRRRLETRLLVKNDSGVYGVTYRWGSSTTDAVLVPEAGMDESFVIQDGDTVRTQVWHYPGRTECLACHTAVAGHALGFNTPQLNREANYGGVLANQITALSEAGYFETDVTEVDQLLALAHATNAQASLEFRVRSYLAANCVQCHQPGGASVGFWDARITTPLAQAGILNGALRDNEGDPANRVVVPGDLAHSILLWRVSQRGPEQMPPLASTVVDTQSVALLSEWITSDLPTTPALNASQGVYGLGETIVIDFANAAGHATDWIGLYPAGAPNAAYVQRLYTDGTTAGTAGLTQGSVSFVGGLSIAGNYEARLFFNDSFSLEASVAFSVEAPPEGASHPSPADSATGVSLNPTLSWTAGAGAASHQVYFGTSPTLGAVDLKATQSGTNYNPGILSELSTYFWRIDEVNARGTTVGPVWSFTTVAEACSCGTLAAWWKAEGDANDSAGANHGILVGGATFEAGRVGQAFRLDGRGNYVSIADSPSLRPANLTIEGWFNFAATNAERILVSKPLGTEVLNSFVLWLYNGGLYGHVGDGSGGGSILEYPNFQPEPRQWYHIAYTVDDLGDFQALYVNGVLAASGVQTKSIEYDGNALVLGADVDFGTAGGFFDGLMDEVSIYPRALGAAEIQAIFENGTRGPDSTPPSLVCPADVTTTCDGSVAPSATGSATATDNCAATPSVTFSDSVAGGPCPAPRIITRTWRATDDCGNTATCRQVIIASPPFLTMSRAVYSPGQVIVVNFTNAAGHATDWIGLYPAGEPNAAYVQRLYTDGTTTGTAGLTQGSVSFVGGLSTPGTYEARLFFDDSFTLEASVGFSVEAAVGVACICALPVASWTAEGNASDSAGANHASLVGGVTFAAGRIGQAFNLDGIDDYLSVADSPSLRPASLTLEGWFNFAATDAERVLVSKPLGAEVLNSFVLWLDNGRLYGHVGDGNGGGSILDYLSFQPVPGEWYHLAYTFNDAADSQALYVNGALVASGVQTKTIAYDGNALILGADVDFGTPAGFFDGLMDEVSIYPRALGPAEIEAIYDNRPLREDTTAPVLACPGNVTIPCGSSTAPSATGRATATDNCDATPSVTFSDSVAGGPCPVPGTITRTWRATDACGNTATCQQVITLAAPVRALRLGIMRIDRGVALEFEALAGESYMIEASTDLIHWVPIATIENAVGRTVVEEQLGPEFPQRFYRAVLAQ